VAEKIIFEFSLSKHTTVPLPDARIFVDKNRNGNIGQDEELTLNNQGRTWTGELSVESSQIKGMLFVVKYRASPGATWQFKAKAGDKVFYDKSNTVQSPRNMLVGALEV
jgi:hypothetical protein